MESKFDKRTAFVLIECGSLNLSTKNHSGDK